MTTTNLIHSLTIMNQFHSEDRETRFQIIRATRNALNAVVISHQTTDRPTDTVADLIDTLGHREAIRAVATLVNTVGDWDGRISRKVREWAASVDAADHDTLSTAGIYQPSKIHPAHIDQIARQMMAAGEPEEESYYFDGDCIPSDLDEDAASGFDAPAVEAKPEETAYEYRFLELDENHLEKMFDSIATLKRLGLSVNLTEYEEAYRGQWVAAGEMAALDDIYQVFNICHPSDYRGRSMSVSDVVELRNLETDEVSFWFCDSFGWVKVDAPEEPEEDKQEAVPFVERSYLSACDLRSLCIKNDWYTGGTCEDYDNLFRMLYDENGCNQDITIEILYRMAKDIWSHSNDLCYSIECIMGELRRACSVYFEAA